MKWICGCYTVILYIFCKLKYQAVGNLSYRGVINSQSVACRREACYSLFESVKKCTLLYYHSFNIFCVGGPFYLNFMSKKIEYFLPQNRISSHGTNEWIDCTGIFCSNTFASWSGAKTKSPTAVEAINQGYTVAIVIGSSSNSIETVASLSLFL